MSSKGSSLFPSPKLTTLCASTNAVLKRLANVASDAIRELAADFPEQQVEGWLAGDVRCVFDEMKKLLVSLDKEAALGLQGERLLKAARITQDLVATWQQHIQLVLINDGPPLIPPPAFDHLLSDVKEDPTGTSAMSLAEVGVELNIVHGLKLDLSDVSECATITGVVTSIFGRLFFPMDVYLPTTGRAMRVVFLCDTGAPVTTLAARTCDYLLEGAETSVPSVAIILNGVRHKVHASGEHFKDINILGSDFLSDTESTLNVDYVKQTACLSWS